MTEDPITKNDIMKMLNNSRNDILNVLNEKFNTLLESVEFCCNKISDFEANLKAANEKINALESLKSVNDALKTKINEMDNKICDLEEYSRKNNVEIQGIPEVRGENVMDIVQSIGNKIGANCDLSTVDVCHRVPSHNKERPKSIIVKFTSRFSKQNFLAGTRLRRADLTTSKIGLNSVPDQQIYVSDHLTPAKKLLLFKTKNFCRDNGYKYTWVSDSKILIRKSDSSRIIVVRSESFLNSLN